jgi:hypothetical protein
MSNYLYSGNQVNVFADGAMSVHDKLVPAVYHVSFDQHKGFYLTRVSDKMELASKTYGMECGNTAHRIMNTFCDRCARNVNTGVLFSGEKGCGKTMTAKTVCNLAIDAGAATVVVNSYFSPSELSDFLKDIDDSCVILFDEFEKNFPKQELQASFLSLLDGVISGTKLFLFTCNNLSHLNVFLLNRPGRIYYHFKFHSLTESTLRGYCEDNLENKDYLKDILYVRNVLGTHFTFDILQSIVEESNRTSLRPSQFIDIMNITAQSSGAIYVVTEHVNSNSITECICTRLNADGTKYISDVAECLSCDRFVVAVKPEAVDKFKEMCTQAGVVICVEGSKVSSHLHYRDVICAKQKGIDLNTAADNVFLIDVLQPGMESVEFTEDGYIVSFALGISLVFKKKKFYNPLYSGVCAYYGDEEYKVVVEADE